MEGGAPRLVYNADDGSVIVEAAGPVITVEGIVGELLFERLTTEGEMAAPLWMSQQEARVLANLGVFLMINPGAGALAAMWLIATYAVVFGVLLTLLAFRVRSLAATVATAASR